MPLISQLMTFMESFAPTALAEEWDNVGLLVGHREREVQRVLTCLTISAPVVEEAVRERADLIVTHHPLPFRPLKSITDETPEGNLLWQLLNAGIGVYSPHTAFDSARDGINQRLAEGLRLTNIAPLVPHPTIADGGGGRWGVFWEAITLAELAKIAKAFLDLQQVQIVGDPKRLLQRVAVACGSAGEFLSVAKDIGCDVLVTGEVRFHTCLEAESKNVALLLLGHYASERFGIERLAEVIAANFSGLKVWASTAERDPLAWL